MARDIGFNINIEGTDSNIRKLGELRDSTIRLGDARKKLEKQAKTAAGLTAAQTKELGDLINQQKVTAKQTNELTKEMDKNTKAANTQANSYDSLTQENAELTSQIRKLGDPLGKNRKQFEALSKRVKDNTGTLKTLDAQMGRNFRNVGNYTGAINESVQASGLFSREIGILRSVQASLAPLLGESAKKTSLFSKAMRLGGIAVRFMLGPIGLLLAAGTALFAFFTKTQRGADILSKVMAGLGAVFNVVVDRVSDFGEFLFDVFTKPKEAFTSFKDTLERGFNFLQKSVWDPFIAFSENAILGIIKGFKTAAAASKEFFGSDATELRAEIADINKRIEENNATILNGAKLIAGVLVEIKNGIAQVTDEMSEELKTAIKLDNRLQRLRDAETAFIVTRSRLRKESELARLAAEDESKTNEERVKQLEISLQKEAEILAQELAFAKERADILTKQEALGKSFTDDEIKAKNEALATVEQLITANAKKQRTIVTRLNSFKRKVEKEENDRFLANSNRRIQLIENEETKAIQAENLRHNQALAKAKDNGEDLELVERVHQQNLANIRAEFAGEKLKNTDETGKKQIQLIKEEGEKELSETEKKDIALAEQTIANRKAAGEFLKNEAFAQAQSLSDGLFQAESEAIERDKERKLEEIALDTQFNLQKVQDEADAENQILSSKLQKGIITEQQFADQQKIADENKRKQQENIQKEGLQKQRQAQKQAFDEKKKLDTAQAITNGALAITSLLAQSPDPLKPIGPLFLSQVAATVGATALNIGKIQAQKFAKGGMVEGPSHAQGGVKFEVGGRVNELEGGEAVINKRSTSMFGGLLSEINQIGGGVKFQRGGITSPTASAPPSAINFSAIASEVAQTIRVENVATETATVNNDVVNVDNVASA